jgi:hypothetical protein
MTDTIFQPTDLANRRTEFLNAARQGLARLRDKDGTSLVMLPERRLLLLQTLAEWSQAHLSLEALLRRPDRPAVSDLGELAWLRAFEVDELREFASELHESLTASYADGSTDALDECLSAWRTTARQLEDPLRRSVLLGRHSPEDFVETSRPDEGE